MEVYPQVIGPAQPLTHCTGTEISIRKSPSPAGRSKRLSDQPAEIYIPDEIFYDNPEAMVVSDCLRLYGGKGLRERARKRTEKESPRDLCCCYLPALRRTSCTQKSLGQETSTKRCGWGGRKGQVTEDLHSFPY